MKFSNVYAPSGDSVRQPERSTTNDSKKRIGFKYLNAILVWQNSRRRAFVVCDRFDDILHIDSCIKKIGSV